MSLRRVATIAALCFALSAPSVAKDPRQLCRKLTGELAQHRELIKKAERALVRVYCHFEDRSVERLPRPGKEPLGFWGGSGVVVNERNVILTARHVLGLDKDKEVPVEIAKPSSCVVEDSSGAFHFVKQMHYNHPLNMSGNRPGADAAILELVDEVGSSIEPLPLKAVSVAADELVIPVAALHENQPKVRGANRRSCLAHLARITHVTPASDYFNGTFRYHGWLEPGNSGSPVLNSKGDLVGISISHFYEDDFFLGVHLGPPILDWRNKLVGKH